MIKLVGAILMLIDHTGALLIPYVLFPCFKFPHADLTVMIFRMIGRLSMPLFAYCIARGFYFSEKKGTVFKYIKNLTIFSIISQIPFTIMPFVFRRENAPPVNLMSELIINIGVTWLFAVIILKCITYIKNPLDKKGILAIVVGAATITASIFAPIDYGLYGVLCVVVFYFFSFKTDSPLFCFVGITALYFLDNMINHLPFFGGSTDQIVSIFSVFLIILMKPHDKKIWLPKPFFYIFYPAHIAIFEIIKVLVIRN